MGTLTQAGTLLVQKCPLHFFDSLFIIEQAPTHTQFLSSPSYSIPSKILPCHRLSPPWPFAHLIFLFSLLNYISLHPLAPLLPLPSKKMRWKHRFESSAMIDWTVDTIIHAQNILLLLFPPCRCER